MRIYVILSLSQGYHLSQIEILHGEYHSQEANCFSFSFLLIILKGPVKVWVMSQKNPNQTLDAYSSPLGDGEFFQLLHR